MLNVTVCCVLTDVEYVMYIMMFILLYVLIIMIKEHKMELSCFIMSRTSQNIGDCEALLTCVRKAKSAFLRLFSILKLQKFDIDQVLITYDSFPLF